jgi:hypothetical protein
MCYAYMRLFQPNACTLAYMVKSCFSEQVMARRLLLTSWEIT